MTKTKIRQKRKHSNARRNGMKLESMKDYCDLVAFECSVEGWSPKELAAYAGVGVPTARNHMRGLVTWPRATTLIAILTALGYTVRVKDEIG